jgi:CRP-like cAMP-binding protein
MPPQSSKPYLTGLTDKKVLLQSHPFFRGLDGRIVEGLVPHALTRNVKRGTLLFRKGDAVCAGAVRVSASSDQGKDAVFSLIVPGELFGEVAFLDGGPRTADAMMIESGELMVIERRDFLPLLQVYPALALRLLELLCGRLRRTSQQVEDIMFLGLERQGVAVSLRTILFDTRAEIESDAARHQPTYRHLARKHQQAAAQLATPQMAKIGTWRTDHPSPGRAEAARHRFSRLAKNSVRVLR